MKIEFPKTLEEQQVVASQISEVKFHIRDRGRDIPLTEDRWVGCSRDGQTWALFITPSYSAEDEAEELMPKDIVAVLYDPPMREFQTIGGILSDAHYQSRELGELDDGQLQAIIQSYEFPAYRVASDYLPCLPEAWRELPVELQVRIGVSAYAGVTAKSYEYYRRDSIEGALATVCAPRVWGILIHYELVVRGAYPIAPFEVDWPLSRRGKKGPRLRGKVSSDVPWEYNADTALLKLYQHARTYGLWSGPSITEKPTVRLCVAGRTGEEAIANWHRIARHLRKMRREVEVT